MPPRARQDAATAAARGGRWNSPRARGGGSARGGPPGDNNPASATGPRAADSVSRGRGEPRGGRAPRGGRFRGRGSRGGNGARGGSASSFAGPSATSSGGDNSAAFLEVAAHVDEVGVRRPGFGRAGSKIVILTNNFGITIPKNLIYHYDVIDSSAELRNPLRFNAEIIKTLQNQVAPDVFSPRVAYDARKNIFSPAPLSFGESAEFTVPTGVQRPGKPPKTCKVRLTKVAEINPEVLHRFVEGQMSQDNEALTAITALNVVIRMSPTMRYPFNVRSFFTPNEKMNIGGGIDLWRGYFQSVRPVIGRMMVNIDISTTAMYMSGVLLEVAMNIMNTKDPRRLYVEALSRRDATKLTRQLAGVKVVSLANRSVPPRSIQQIVATDNANKTFELTQGDAPAREVTIANYYREVFNKTLMHPQAVLADLGRGAFVPLELLNVPPGQIMKKAVPSDLTKRVVEFATKRPVDRLQSIRDGFQVLEHGQSEYMNSFGMQVNQDPLALDARVLPPPTLQYGEGSRQPTIVPQGGSWNMVDKRFFAPSNVTAWAVVIYERQNRFNARHARDMINGLRRAAQDSGIVGFEREPIVKWENGQGRIGEQIRNIGREVKETQGPIPNLIVCILPDSAADIYIAIKHFGDITAGVATQCLKSSKCHSAKSQYYANVLLKVNVKLGGINAVPEARSVPFLSDPMNPVLVLGADVMHPPQGSVDRPSYASMIGNVDGGVSKYVSTICVQTPRQEIIEETQAMVQYILEMYRDYRTRVEKKSPVPKRVIFYRDGVSEGEYRAVLDREILKIKDAFTAAGIDPPPKLTVVVVAKRHHVRFFPTNPNDADKSGNCPSGTIVDTAVVHPTTFDFYLQSHGGLLGTSRPAHYTVLHDENGFQADTLQQLTFALCHVFARSTRTVSIPAPVYYADIVCSRARTHYDPEVQHSLAFSDEQSTSAGTGTGTGDASTRLQRMKEAFKPLHPDTATKMYFN